MAFRFVSSGWQTALKSESPPEERVYIDFRQKIYPSIYGTPTYALITSGDNQPGSHVLTGGSMTYLLDSPTKLSAHFRIKPTQAYNAGVSQYIFGWYYNGSNFVTLYYHATAHTYIIRVAKAGTVSQMTGQVYTSNGQYQVWTDLAFSYDLSAGTGRFYENYVERATSWSVSTPAVHALNYPIFELNGFNSTASNNKTAFARLFPGFEATGAQILSDFSANAEDADPVLAEEIYWSLNGVSYGQSRCNVTKFVEAHAYKAEAEKEESASIAANTLKLSLKNVQGEFSDDQYATFDAESSVYNGTSAQKYMAHRTPVFIEHWYGHEFEPIFLGRVDEKGYQRTMSPARVNRVELNCEDYAAEIARKKSEVNVGYDDKKISDATEANSLVHLLARVSTARRVYNYFGNSSFEQTPLTNAWGVATVGGGALTFTRTGGAFIFGTYFGRASYDGGGTYGYIQQTIMFDGDVDRLNVGEKYTAGFWIRAAAACGYNWDLRELDGSGANQTVNEDWALAGGESWVLVQQTITITDTESDRLDIVFRINDAVDVDFGGAMLVLGPSLPEWFVTNNNAGSSATVDAEDAAYGEYNLVGFDVDAVNETVDYALLPTGDSPWDHLQQIADATMAYYLGLDQAGTMRFRTPFKTGYSDPTPTYTLAAPMKATTDMAVDRYNRIVVRGVKIQTATDYSKVWDAALSGDFAASDYILNDGDYFPPAALRPYWAKLVQIEAAGPSSPSPISQNLSPGVRVVKNLLDDEVIGVSNLWMKANLWYNRGIQAPPAMTQTTFDTTSKPGYANILLQNNTGYSNVRMYVCAIYGKIVRRLSGENGWIHDLFKDDYSIRANGESTFELENNYLCTSTLVDKAAEYLWKENQLDRHKYKVRYPGCLYYLNPGEWVTFTYGGAGQSENVNSTCRIVRVDIQRKAGDIGTTTLVLEEVQQNWTAQSTLASRKAATAYPVDEISGYQVVVASTTAGGNAARYCDGTADDVDIQAALDGVGIAGGGTVVLTLGTFNTTSLIIVPAGVRLAGNGPDTIISGTGSGNIIQLEDGAQLVDLTVKNAETTYYAKYLIDGNEADGCLVSNVKMDFTKCGGLLLDGNDNRVLACRAYGGRAASALSYGSSADLYSHKSTDYPSIAMLSATQAVVVNLNSSTVGMAAIADISGVTITPWGGYQFAAIGSTSAYCAVAALTSTKFVIVWGDTTNANACARIGTITAGGHVISYGAEVQFSTAAYSRWQNVHRIDDNTFCWVGKIGTTYAYGCIGTVSGSTITLGSNYALNASGTVPDMGLGSAMLDSTHVVAGYEWNGIDGHAYAIVGSISGTTITWGTAVDMTNSLQQSSNSVINVVALSSSRFVMSVCDQGPESALVQGYVSGTTVTPAGVTAIFEDTTAVLAVGLAKIDDYHVLICGDFYDYDDTSYYPKAMIATLYGETAVFSDPLTLVAEISTVYWPLIPAVLATGKAIVCYPKYYSAKTSLIVFTYNTSVDAVRVTGDRNIVQGNQLVGVASYTQEAGIRVVGDDNQIVNNLIDGNVSASQLIDVGIAVEDGAQRTQINSNRAINCVAHGIVNAGDYTLFDGGNTMYNNGADTTVETV